MIYTEQQLLAAGFVATVEGLPHELRSYEYRRPSGDILVFTSAAKNKPVHTLVEFAGTGKLRMLAIYRIGCEAQLAELIDGTLKPFYVPKGRFI